RPGSDGPRAPGRLRDADRAPARLLPGPPPAVDGLRRGRRRGRQPGHPTPGGPSRVILLKSPRELALMRRAGQVLAEVTERLTAWVGPGLSSQEIDEDVENFIRARGAAPAFKGYRGFPATVCVSINEEIVHGIPSAHRRLKEGDIVGLDLGCIVEGYYADCAFTMAIGEIPARVQELLEVTRQSLELAIVQCRPGQRLSDVSNAVQRHV